MQMMSNKCSFIASPPLAHPDMRNMTEDGFVLQPGRAPARGRAALARVYAGQGGGALRLRALAYAHADTVGYIIGAYGYGDSPGDEGKFTLTVRRGSNGRWLIASDRDNGSKPPSR